jgi:hypothetical protein
MGTRRRQTTARTAARNITQATNNARAAVRLADTSAEVISRRMQAPITPLEGFLMVFEKMMAAQTAWWSAGSAYATSTSRLARASATGPGLFGPWETALATSVQTAAMMLRTQHAMMAPFWSAANANRKRLARASR